MDGKACGKGKLTYCVMNKISYVKEGEFKNDKLNGQGKKTSYEVDGKTISLCYEGNYINDRKNGQGKYTSYIDGKVFSVYEGEWVNGKENGQGTKTYADGTVKSGTWKDGSFVG